MDFINEYNVSFPIEKIDVIEKIKNIQKDLVLKKGLEQDEQATEELTVIEKLNEVIEFTPDSRTEKIVLLYNCLIKCNFLSDTIHHIVLDYMKGDFDALKKIDELCEKQNKEALLAKAFYLYDGTFDIKNKRESTKCLKKLCSMGFEDVYEYVYENKYNGNYLIIKTQTTCSLLLLIFAIVLTSIMLYSINQW